MAISSKRPDGFPAQHAQSSLASAGHYNQHEQVQSKEKPAASSLLMSEAAQDFLSAFYRVAEVKEGMTI